MSFLPEYCTCLVPPLCVHSLLHWCRCLSPHVLPCGHNSFHAEPYSEYWFSNSELVLACSTPTSTPFPVGLDGPLLDPQYPARVSFHLLASSSSTNKFNTPSTEKSRFRKSGIYSTSQLSTDLRSSGLPGIFQYSIMYVHHLLHHLHSNPSQASQLQPVCPH